MEPGEGDIPAALHKALRKFGLWKPPHHPMSAEWMPSIVSVESVCTYMYMSQGTAVGDSSFGIWVGIQTVYLTNRFIEEFVSFKSFKQRLAKSQ